MQSVKRSGFRPSAVNSGSRAWARGEMDSPIGQLSLIADEFGLRAIRFPASKPVEQEAEIRRDFVPLMPAIEQLRAYFGGELQQFELALSPSGSEFQQTVWQALAEIPYGETISYSTLATRIGRPRAVRAVGAANGANPLPIVLPCHRVIGSDGSLTGFGGGLPSKAWLLSHERRRAESQQGEFWR